MRGMQMIRGVNRHDVRFRIIEDILVTGGITGNPEFMAALLTQRFVAVADVSEFELFALQDRRDGTSSFTKSQDRYGRFFHLDLQLEDGMRFRNTQVSPGAVPLMPV